MRDNVKSKDFLAVLDIGNTNVKGALFRGGRIVRRWSAPASAGLRPDFVRRLLAAKLGAAKGGLRGVCIASVVPQLNKKFAAVCKNVLGARAHFATPQTIGVPLGRYSPREIGADRLVGARAALEIYKMAVIVIGAGTGLTFDAVDAKGRYLGGAIAPGLGMAARALNEMTARLPLVKISKPRRAIGASTRECISSGIYHGWAGLVRNVVKEISSEMKTKPRVIATGKDAKMIAKASGVIDEVRSDLLFEGLKIVWDDFRCSFLGKSLRATSD